jgi:alpha-D-ribose 1-methylphosphonate 5-triphosphate synthase subunit PhnH
MTQTHPNNPRPNRMGQAFTDPVLQTQTAFRSILAAMAEPGTIAQLTAVPDCPPLMHPSTIVALLTLADRDTPLWIAPSLGTEGSDYLRFHVGAPVAETAGAARFAVIDPASPVSLAAFDGGSDRYPDTSATGIVQCDSLSGGEPVSLSGPGIKGVRTIAPSGLHRGFWADVVSNHALYPRGIDLLLVSGTSLMALPRSTCPRLLPEGR